VVPLNAGKKTSSCGSAILGDEKTPESSKSLGSWRLLPRFWDEDLDNGEGEREV
jgi:hypothetical protein